MRREAAYKSEFAVCIMDECRTSTVSSRPRSQGLRESRSGPNSPPSRQRPRSTEPTLPRFGGSLRRCSVKSSESPEPAQRPLKQVRRVENRLMVAHCDSERPGWPAIARDWDCLPLTSESCWVSLANPSISGRLARCGRVKVSWRPLQPLERWADEKLWPSWQRQSGGAVRSNGEGAACANSVSASGKGLNFPRPQPRRFARAQRLTASIASWGDLVSTFLSVRAALGSNSRRRPLGSELLASRTTALVASSETRHRVGRGEQVTASDWRR